MSYLEALNGSSDPSIDEAVGFALEGNPDRALDLIREINTPDANFIKAILLLSSGQKNEALELFNAVNNHPDGSFLAPAFCDFITETNEEADKMYGGEEFLNYFKAAASSLNFQGIYRAVDNTVRDLFSGAKELCFIDIGIGTGKQAAMLAEMLEANPEARGLLIIGIEPYPSMQKMAAESIRALSSSKHYKIEYHLIDKYAQDICASDITKIIGDRKIDIINASASIHHMPLEKKKKLLGVIKTLDPRFFIISDADSDHESNLHNFSLELIANVTSFYKNFLDYMLTIAPDEKTKKLYRGFCYYDAKNIIMSLSNKRIEYHTTKENWKSYLVECGFRLISPRNEWLRGIDPRYSRISGDYLITAYYNRPLLFQLTATIADRQP